VIGQQWEWRFSNPSFHDAQGEPIVALQLYLPVNQPVNFKINSVDVIHTFWVPAFRLQEDAVPGITTSFRATPDRLGSYPIICTQLCGYGHSTMRSTLHIVTAAAFRTWLAQHGYSGSYAGPSAQTAAARSTASVHRGHLAATRLSASAPLGGTHIATKEGSQ
jgi:cytochrome c oxidase subunit 2